MQGDERASDEDVICDLLACAQTWEPDARLIGNVRAGDVVRALASLAAKDEKIAALRAEVERHKRTGAYELGFTDGESRTRALVAELKATVSAQDREREECRAELSRLRARDERTARVIEAEPFDLRAHLARQREWSERTFGPGSRAAGVIDHIRKELREIEASPEDLEEWIDVVILAFDGAWRSGHTPDEIIAQLVAKQTKNERRQWPDWRTAEAGKAIEHVRKPVCAVCNDTHSVPVPEERAARGDTGPFGDGTWMCTSCPTPCQECRAGGRGAYCETTPCPCKCHRARAQQRIGACLSMPPELAAAELRAISEAERAEEESG